MQKLRKWLSFGKSKSVLKEWIISYLIVLVIPVIALILNYVNNVTIIKQEIKHANEAIMDNAVRQMDSHIAQMNLLYNDILLSDEFSLLSKRQTLNREFYNSASELKEQLRLFSLNQYQKLSCLVYFDKSDYILDMEGGAESNSFYYGKGVWISKLPAYEEWMEIVGGSYQRKFYVDAFPTERMDKEYLIYANTVSWKGTVGSNVMIGVPISLLEAYTVDLDEKAILLILHRDEPLLALSRKGMITLTEDLKGLAVRFQDDEAAFEDREYIGMKKKSGNVDFAYALLIPTERFWKKSQVIRDVLCISLCLSLLVGFLCVSCLIRHNFKPIHKLMHIMGRNESHENEFTQMELAYLNVRGENRKNYLLALLKGRMTAQLTYNEYMEELRGETDGKQLLLACFEVPLSDAEQLKYEEILFFSINNIFEELFAQDIYHCVEDGQYLWYLFLVSPDNVPQWKQSCLERLGYLYDFMLDKFGVELGVAVSGWEHEITMIKFQYQDILDVLEYQDIVGNTGIMDTEVQESDYASGSMDIRRKAIRKAMECMDYDQVAELSRDLFAERNPLLVIQGQIFNIFQDTLSLFEHMNMENKKRKQNLIFLERMLKAADRTELEALFDEWIRWVCVDEKDSLSRQHALVKQIQDYVACHYEENGLNVNSIADAFELHPKYISSIFRNETGQRILDYISQVRIEKAKLLLSEGTYSVESVAKQVGYSCDKTFRRAFVKIVGEAPGKYIPYE